MYTSLIDILLPQEPPEPVGARLVSLWDEAPTTSQAKREGNKRWYERNKESARAAALDRYRRKQNADDNRASSTSAIHCEGEKV